jgi:hypothetical protein
MTANSNPAASAWVKTCACVQRQTSKEMNCVWRSENRHKAVSSREQC